MLGKQACGVEKGESSTSLLETDEWYFFPESPNYFSQVIGNCPSRLSHDVYFGFLLWWQLQARGFIHYLDRISLDCSGERGDTEDGPSSSIACFGALGRGRQHRQPKMLVARRLAACRVRSNDARMPSKQVYKHPPQQLFFAHVQVPKYRPSSSCLGGVAGRSRVGCSWRPGLSDKQRKQLDRRRRSRELQAWLCGFPPHQQSDPASFH